MAELGDYDWCDDMHKSWLFALEAIRARVAAGGHGWGGYGPSPVLPNGNAKMESQNNSESALTQV